MNTRNCTRSCILPISWRSGWRPCSACLTYVIVKPSFWMRCNRLVRRRSNILRKQFGVSAGSMSSMIVRLLALGHITQITNPKDRRRDIVDITSSGQSALRGVHEVWREGDRMIEAALGREKSEQFINHSTRAFSKALWRRTSRERTERLVLGSNRISTTIFAYRGKTRIWLLPAVFPRRVRMRDRRGWVSSTY